MAKTRSEEALLHPKTAIIAAVNKPIAKKVRIRGGEPPGEKKLSSLFP